MVAIIRPRTILLALCCGCASPAAGYADAPTVGQILNQFSLVTLGNTSASGEIDGAALIGGTLSGSSGASFFPDVSNTGASPGVDVYGSVSGSGISIDHGANLYYKGTLSGGQVNFPQGGSQITAGPPTALSVYSNTLKNGSSWLASQSATSGDSISVSSSKVTFNATNANSSNGIAVLSITESQLHSDMYKRQVNFNIGSGVGSVVVNVTGSSSFGMPTNTTWSGGALSNVLFNFNSAPSVTVGNWQASILAPNGTVKTRSSTLVNGSVAAKSYSGSGQVENAAFTGALPVPEPASLGLLGVGLAALAAARRRRYRASQPIAASGSASVVRK